MAKIDMKKYPGYRLAATDISFKIHGVSHNIFKLSGAGIAANIRVGKTTYSDKIFDGECIITRHGLEIDGTIAIGLSIGDRIILGHVLVKKDEGVTSSCNFN